MNTHLQNTYVSTYSYTRMLLWRDVIIFVGTLIYEKYTDGTYLLMGFTRSDLKRNDFELKKKKKLRRQKRRRR